MSTLQNLASTARLRSSVSQDGTAGVASTFLAHRRPGWLQVVKIQIQCRLLRLAKNISPSVWDGTRAAGVRCERRVICHLFEERSQVSSSKYRADGVILMQNKHSFLVLVFFTTDGRKRGPVWFMFSFGPGRIGSPPHWASLPLATVPSLLPRVVCCSAPFYS